MALRLAHLDRRCRSPGAPPSLFGFLTCSPDVVLLQVLTSPLVPESRSKDPADARGYETIADEERTPLAADADSACISLSLCVGLSSR